MLISGKITKNNRLTGLISKLFFESNIVLKYLFKQVGIYVNKKELK